MANKGIRISMKKREKKLIEPLNLSKQATTKNTSKKTRRIPRKHGKAYIKLYPPEKQ